MTLLLTGCPAEEAQMDDPTLSIAATKHLDTTLHSRSCRLPRAPKDDVPNVARWQLYLSS